MQSCKSKMARELDPETRETSHSYPFNTFGNI